MKTQKARKLFFDYDGSRFFMARDDVEAEYLNFKVDAATETKWLIELTDQKLKDLEYKGNWRSVYFFNHHQDYRYLTVVSCTKAKGVFWERCAFLEESLAYAFANPANSINTSLVKEVVQKVLEQGELLLTRVKAEGSIARVNAIIKQCRFALKKMK